MILVTGGLGFIGSHTARALLDLGESCVLTRYRKSKVPSFLESEIGRRAYIEQVDITDASAFLSIGERHKITGIVHLAMTGSGMSDPFDYFRANTDSLQSVLQAAHKWGVTRVSFASAIGVYMGVGECPFQEDMPLTMTADNPFTTFKKSSELIATYIAGRLGFEIVNLRISGAWGPLQKSAANLVVASQLVHAAVGGLQPTFSGQVLDAYDMCYVKDCAQAIAQLQVADKLNHNTYNIGSGRIVKNQEFVAAIKSVIPGAKLELPEGPCLDMFLDIARIRQEIAYEPEYDVEKGIFEYVSWLKSGNEV
ncbi:NAD-dependent epimerase/dehydratase family protein [Paenibacillus humicola]|uniref:NAD-dependent epimerase/dehydratase family protein n=1 Tax=Paenibacillus humicola TaxID=3110540 RepID=UPI00237B24E3|nr:NAD(P)-dependent oxidoreductase [Paenibacillus humicola]